MPQGSWPLRFRAQEHLPRTGADWRRVEGPNIDGYAVRGDAAVAASCLRMSPCNEGLASVREEMH